MKSKIYWIVRCLVYECARWLALCSPLLATRLLYLFEFRKKLDLDNPKTLNEKVQWLKLFEYKDNDLITMCVDKYRVREYIEKCGYSSILNELYYQWEKVEDIDWDVLPDRFVLKCNHGWAYNVICENKELLNRKETEKLLKKWLKINFWREKAEVNYRDVKPCIICEKFLQEGSAELMDYKIYCFNGKPEYIMVCVSTEERRKFYYFDMDWNMQKLSKDSIEDYGKANIPKPEKLQELYTISKELSKPFPFVRIDYYIVEGNIIFGEMTFTPGAGLDTKRLKETDLLFGDKLKIK